MSRLVLVTGGAGYIGRRLAARLDPESWRVRALARDPEKARRQLPPGVELVRGDMTDEASLRSALAGAAAVVHLAARKSDERDIEAVNVGGARNLAAACRAAGVARVVNVSSQATRMRRRGDYGDTKARGDEVLAAAGLELTTLIPSVVYGPEDPGVFGKLARVAAASPVVPVIGDGSARYQPVHVDDLCAVIAGCLDEPATIGKTWSVGGPEPATLEQLIDLAAAAKGRKPLKVHLPGGAALLLARVTAPFFSTPPLSRSNVLGALESVPDADYGAAFRALGLRARGLAEGLPGCV